MTKKMNDCVAAIVRELAQVGIRCEQAITGSCHVKITWRTPTRKRVYFTGLSPSGRERAMRRGRVRFDPKWQIRKGCRD